MVRARAGIGTGSAVSNLDDLVRHLQRLCPPVDRPTPAHPRCNGTVLPLRDPQLTALVDSKIVQLGHAVWRANERHELALSYKHF
jgi:hypothetical protein